MRLAIVGGGITGLAAAFEAHQAGVDFHLFEAGDRFGGAIQTIEHEGAIMEAGPDSILKSKPWAYDLVRELDMVSEVVTTQDQPNGSFIVRDRELHPIPQGFRLMAPTAWLQFLRSPIVSWPGKFRVLLEPFIPARQAAGDESLTGFVTRRLGREVLERLAQPMVSGIYSADPDRLSLEATMPIFLRLEREHGSIIRGLRATGEGAKASGAQYNLFFNLKGGSQRLVEALVDHLPADRLHLNSPVSKLAPGWSFQAGDESHQAEAVLVGLPGPQAAQLLAFDSDLSGLFSRVRYSSAALVNLVYDLDDLADLPPGYGFVVPAIEHMHLLACTFSHLKWPGRNPGHLGHIRAYFGGAHNQAVLERPDHDLVALARSDLARLTALEAEPVATFVHHHRNGLPEYSVGHREWQIKVEARAATHPGLGLAGNAFDGVGIPDCVRRGRETARRLF
ncbi:MAG: protoporphyrinogen oxidase [Vulcanimicrobiota bacterium]